MTVYVNGGWGHGTVSAAQTKGLSIPMAPQTGELRSEKRSELPKATQAPVKTLSHLRAAFGLAPPPRRSLAGPRRARAPPFPRPRPELELPELASRLGARRRDGAAARGPARRGPGGGAGSRGGKGRGENRGAGPGGRARLRDAAATPGERGPGAGRGLGRRRAGWRRGRKDRGRGGAPGGPRAPTREGVGGRGLALPGPGRRVSLPPAPAAPRDTEAGGGAPRGPEAQRVPDSPQPHRATPASVGPVRRTVRASPGLSPGHVPETKTHNGGPGLPDSHQGGPPGGAVTSRGGQMEQRGPRSLGPDARAGRPWPGSWTAESGGGMERDAEAETGSIGVPARREARSRTGGVREAPPGSAGDTDRGRQGSSGEPRTRPRTGGAAAGSRRAAPGVRQPEIVLRGRRRRPAALLRPPRDSGASRGQPGSRSGLLDPCGRVRQGAELRALSSWRWTLLEPGPARPLGLPGLRVSPAETPRMLAQYGAEPAS
ncbi:uncharacterized protein AAEQ78_005897 [Lycaon pictus]